LVTKEDVGLITTFSTLNLAGIIVWYEEVGDDGTRRMVSEGVGDTAVNPVSVCGNGSTLNESREGILDVGTHRKI
jgi:hypothetical protein